MSERRLDFNPPPLVLVRVARGATVRMNDSGSAIRHAGELIRLTPKMAETLIREQRVTRV